MCARLEIRTGLLNQYISARARLKLGRSPRSHSVPPGRAQREPQGYAGLTTDRTPRRARAVRAKCSLAGLTNPQNTNIMIFNFIFPLACDLVLATCACSSRKSQRIVDVLRPSILKFEFEDVRFLPLTLSLSNLLSARSLLSHKGASKMLRATGHARIVNPLPPASACVRFYLYPLPIGCGRLLLFMDGP